MENKYRIVKDHCLGYEVQCKRWWFPFWVQIGDHGYSTNTSPTIDIAKKLIDIHKRGSVYEE